MAISNFLLLQKVAQTNQTKGENNSIHFVESPFKKMITESILNSILHKNVKLLLQLHRLDLNGICAYSDFVSYILSLLRK